MKKPEIRAAMQALGDNGVFSDNTRYDNAFWDEAIDKARATVLLDFFKNTKRINPIWTQQFVATYESDLQDDNCLVRFRVPPVLTLDVFFDGFIYVGSIDGNVQYRKLNTRADLANSNMHRHTKIRTDQFKFIYSDGFIEVYGNTELQDLRVDGIFLKPTDVPTYNVDADEYPIDNALIPQLQQVLFNTETKPEISQPGKVMNQNESR